MLSRHRIRLVVSGLSILALTALVRASAVLSPLPIQSVRIDDPFWSPKREVWRKVTIADCFDKFEKDGALTNFDKIRDGRGGEHGGPPWYDGLVYEMITASADFMREQPDAQLQHRIDGYIERIAAAAAKDPNGYINTYTQLKEPTHRWGTNGGNDRWEHDLYNAGCLVEAAVHYYRATGNPQLLRVATKLANHMCDVMGPPPRQNIIPGHAIGELSFTELFQLFRADSGLKKQIPFNIDESRYLRLAQFWIDNRGNHDGRRDLGAYDQDDRPVVQQPTIEGHAVRATLMATGLTALASETNRDEYCTTARRLWQNMVERRMYVTGGVGAIAGDEKFGDDYVLPNNGYLETCAAVGAAFFHHRMNLDTADARSADELERVLYNGALCGVSLSGNRYFYENPLEAGKNRLRWEWHACPCCPPMFLKLMSALPSYIYATDTKGLYVNLYVGSTAHTMVGGTQVVLRQATNYPWSGDVRISIESERPAEWDLNLRVPAWCQAPAGHEELYVPAGRPQSGAFTVTVNGQAMTFEIEKGYAKLHRRWLHGDVIEITMKMPARRLEPNSKIAATVGRVALSRGPLLYCLESIDNQRQVRNTSLPDSAELRIDSRPNLLGGITIVRASALASAAESAVPKPIDLIAIPYYANANRGPVSMRVWIPRSTVDVLPARESADDVTH